jgi:hypothetical protein
MEILNGLVGFANQPSQVNAGFSKRRRGHHILSNKTIKNSKHITSKMTCSPHSTHTKPAHLDYTCYTPAILERIRTEYNKSHPSKEHIRTTNPQKIWQELDARLSHCSKEDCWLNQIRDDKLRKMIDRYMFAPDQPYEWKRNPTEWLSNYDILNVLEQYELVHKDFEFIGPTPIDFDTRLDGASNPYNIGNEKAKHAESGKKCVWNDLCHFSLKDKIREKKTKLGIIFNLDKHNQSGSHWVSMFIDMADPEPYMFYFNSTAEPMPSEVRKLMDRIQKQWLEKHGLDGLHEKKNHKKLIEYTSDDKVEHQHSNTECGMYSLFFIITCLTRKVGGFKTLGSGLSREKIIEMFAGKTRIPDRYMLKFRNLYFIKGTA